MSTLPPIKEEKKKKKKKKKQDEEDKKQNMSNLPSEDMFSLMERRGVYSSKQDDAENHKNKKKKKKSNGNDRSNNLKAIQKAQKKTAKNSRKEKKKKEKGDWDNDAKKRARLKNAAALVDKLDRNCDENGKKKNKAARRRQRQLQLQALKPGNGPSNMPLPEPEPEKEKEPEIEPEQKVVEEVISSDDEEKIYDYEKTEDDSKKKRKLISKKMMEIGDGVPKEMRKKKWKLGIRFENPWTKIKRGCGEKMMTCGSAFRYKFQKSKRINMEAVLAPDSYSFGKQLEAQLRNEEDGTLLERSEETRPDRDTDGVLEKEKKELTRAEEAQKKVAEAEATARGEELVDEEDEELTTRTALEVICKHISGVDCLEPLRPEKVYEFFQFDLRTRNTLELYNDLQPLKTSSVGQLIDFAKNYSASGMLNCVSLGMFVDEEQQRFLARKHAAENWTCFFCFSLEKVEDTSCNKCGQTRAATQKAKRQEDQHKAAKAEEKRKKRWRGQSSSSR